MVDDSKPPKPFVPPSPDEETRLYWDRLDARFANLNPAPPTAPVARPLPAPPAAVAAPAENVVPTPASAAAPAEVAPPSWAAPAAFTASPVVTGAAPTVPVPPVPTPEVPVPVTVSDAPGVGLVADAFAALLALEDGQPGARPVRLTIGNQTPPPSPPEITDAMIENIVRRVVERLGPDAVRAVVVDVVSHISERLVKEEIERIRNQHA